MTQPSVTDSSWNRLGGGENAGGQAPQVGSKRAKLKGYLQAANELRQTYQQQYASGWNNRTSYLEEGDDGPPGSYPDASVVRSGDEQMVLFPSYARRHIKEKPRAKPGTIQETGGQGHDVRDTAGEGDAEYWRQQWEKYEEDNAVVDVDVRGWIFSPHKGQMTRKQRLFVTLARQLAGLPAPTQTSPSSSPQESRATSPHSAHRDRVEARERRRDEEFVSKQAEDILKKGEAEAEAAGRGEYSESPSQDATDDAAGGKKDRSGHPDRVRQGSETNTLRRLAASNAAGNDDDPKITPVQKRASWNQPADMSASELFTANAHLMARLKPFISNPLANTPISAFFYNENISRQRTVHTDAYGHFALRAALDFVPTHVRILASENLSATEEVLVTDPEGISLISDIDDTIKHSAIGSGAREIFRNAFIRELDDLTIDGVREWYNDLSKMGVKFHYVSNSPWQLYPVLTKFFAQAGLPPGSFHLKQYSGMMQGIFEPVAERKKGTLDRIARDFPKRRFILVGDSGEADLEVYLDFVQENPGRVIGIFIRDVTTPVNQGFFDHGMGSLAGNKSGNSTPHGGVSPKFKAQIVEEDDDDPDLRAAIEASLKDVETEERSKRPALPPRRTTEKLIDFSDDESESTKLQSPPLSRAQTDSSVPYPSKCGSDASVKSMPPVPRKPANLRSTTSQVAEGITKRAPPPPPSRRSTASSQITSEQSKPAPPIPHSSKPSAASQPSNVSDESYGAFAREKFASAYQHLPTAPWSSTPEKGNSTDSHVGSLSSPPSKPAEQEEPMPPTLPRRPITSYPVAAAQYASTRVNSAWQAYNNGSPAGTPGASRYSTSTASGMPPGNGGPPPVNKRVDMWRSRWERAENYCKHQGVVLKSWTVGSDVLEETKRLVEKALKEEKSGEKKIGR